MKIFKKLPLLCLSVSMAFAAACDRKAEKAPAAEAHHYTTHTDAEREYIAHKAALCLQSPPW